MQDLPGSLQRALEAIQKHGKAHYRDIAKDLKVRPNTARRYLDQLARLGYLEKLESGYYRVKSGEKPREAEKTPEPEAPAQHLTVGEEEYQELRKPVGELIEPLFFHYKGSMIPLRVESITQLFAVVKYKLLSPQELSYAVKTGYLQAWVSRVIRDEELAKEIEALSGLPPEEIAHNLASILEKRVK